MGEMFFLKCPYCRQPVHVSASSPGQPANCPSCRKQFRVPAGAKPKAKAQSTGLSAAMPAADRPLDPNWSATRHAPSPSPAALVPAAPAPGGTPAPPPAHARPMDGPTPGSFSPPMMSFESAPARPSGRVTPLMADALTGTRPWVMLFGVLWMLMGGLVVIGALMNLFAGQVFAALVQLVMSAVWLMPGLHLFRYAGHIAAFRDSGSESDMEHALVAQRSYWKFIGITAIVFLALAVVGMLLSFMMVGAMM